jgi:2-dehydropantoate 2-reductase
MNTEISAEGRIAFFGAGAMGSYIGGRIAQSGREVLLVDPWKEHVEAIKRDGIHLSGTEGASSVRLSALHVDEAETLADRPIDVGFIAVKSYDTEWAARLASRYLAPAGFVVSLQNGINEQAIAEIVGAAKTLGCIASTMGVALRGPGRVERTYRPGGDAYTVFRVGELDGHLTPRVKSVVSLLGLVDSAVAITDLWGERWAKLSANSMHNGLAAISGLGHMGIYSQSAPRWLAIRLGGEAVRVGRALGLRLHPVRGIPADDLEAAGFGDARALKRVERVIESSMSRLTEDLRPSTAQDVIKGRRTEIDFINGAVCRKAAEVSVSVPCQQAIVDLVKRIERGELSPGIQNIAGL